MSINNIHTSLHMNEYDTCAAVSVAELRACRFRSRSKTTPGAKRICPIQDKKDNS